MGVKEFFRIGRVLTLNNTGYTEIITSLNAEKARDKPLVENFKYLFLTN